MHSREGAPPSGRQLRACAGPPTIFGPDRTEWFRATSAQALLRVILRVIIRVGLSMDVSTVVGILGMLMVTTYVIKRSKGQFIEDEVVDTKKGAKPVEVN